MYRAFASLSYSSLIISLCALLDAQGVTTDTTRTSPALASVYMTSSLRPSSARPVCTRLFGLGCIGRRLLRTLRMSATVTRLSCILLWPWGVGVIFMASSRSRAGTPPKDTPAWSNTLCPRRYPGQVPRIYVEGRPYLAGRRGQRMHLACLDARKCPP